MSLLSSAVTTEPVGRMDKDCYKLQECVNPQVVSERSWLQCVAFRAFSKGVE